MQCTRRLHCDLVFFWSYLRYFFCFFFSSICCYSFFRDFVNGTVLQNIFGLPRVMGFHHSSLNSRHLFSICMVCDFHSDHRLLTITDSSETLGVPFGRWYILLITPHSTFGSFIVKFTQTTGLVYIANQPGDNCSPSQSGGLKITKMPLICLLKKEIGHGHGQKETPKLVGHSSTYQDIPDKCVESDLGFA